MKKQQIIFYSVIGLIIIISILLIKTLFSGKGNSIDEVTKQRLADKDSVIAIYQRQIEASNAEIAKKDKLLQIYQENDSVLNAHYLQTEKLYNDLSKNIKNIPSKLPTDDSGIIASYRSYRLQ